MNNKTPITVTVLEDEKVFRESIELLINSTDDLQCIKTFEGVSDFIKDMENTRPDVYWFDLQLLDGTGVEAISRVKALRPEALCLVCTFFSDENKIFEALKAGADGYLIKGEGNDKILNSIRELYYGGAPISSVIARKVLKSFSIEENTTPKQNVLEALTQRENEILKELAKGLLYKEIAANLNISLETVKKHVQNIYAKLHVNNKTEAVVKFMENHS